MNTSNLIAFGIFCGYQFRISPGFRIMQIPSDFRGEFRVAYPLQGYGRCLSEDSSIPPNSSSVGYDDVELIQMGSLDNYEKIWAGYSSLANMLIYQDRSGTVAKLGEK